ncbi:MAG: hypothetical protein ACXWRZ_14200 [Bdellovibrio sp.]
MSTAYADQVEIPAKKSPSAGLDYWFVKNLILDVDEELKTAGLQVKACTYRSLITKKDSSFQGLGPCLWLNFSESMDTRDRLTGVTYFWLDDSQKQPIEIHWRPPKEGMSQWLDQAYEMKFEKSLYWWRSLSEKKQADKVPYKEFLLGEIKLVLPNEEVVLKKLEVNGNPWISNKVKGLRELELKISPTERKDGVVVHSGVIQAKLQSPDGKEDDLTLAVKTNINILVLDRKWFFNAENEVHEDWGPLPGVAHEP